MPANEMENKSFYQDLVFRIAVMGLEMIMLCPKRGSIYTFRKSRWLILDQLGPVPRWGATGLPGKHGLGCSAVGWGQFDEEQGICMASRHLPTNCLFVAREKIVTTQGRNQEKKATLVGRWKLTSVHVPGSRKLTDITKAGQLDPVRNPGLGPGLQGGHAPKHSTDRHNWTWAANWRNVSAVSFRNFVTPLWLFKTIT